jgi:hypothetical protein
MQAKGGSYVQCGWSIGDFHRPTSNAGVGEIGVRLAENARVELTGNVVVVFKGELYV